MLEPQATLAFRQACRFMDMLRSTSFRGCSERALLGQLMDIRALATCELEQAYHKANEAYGFNLPGLDFSI
jgi:hypothetical protein